MKKTISAVLAAVMGISLTACSSAASTASAGTSSAAHTYRAAMKSATTISAEDITAEGSSAEFDTLYCGLIVNENNEIVYVNFDIAQNSVTLNADGTLTAPEETPTKREKGDAYGMSGASSIGKDWYQQADALEDWMTGRTVDEVLGMETAEGKAVDEDVLSGCTIHVTGFISALSAANDALTEIEGTPVKAELGSVTSFTVDEASVQGNTTLAFAAVDADGKIVYSDFDVAQNSVSVEDGAWAVPAETPTKKEKGDAYGMVNASSIGKEWYEQIGAFEDYTIGKTLDEVTSMELSENKTTDADLLTGCTIKLPGYISALTHAETFTKEVK